MKIDAREYLDQIHKHNLSLEEAMVLGVLKAKADPITGIGETTAEEITDEINSSLNKLQMLGLISPVFDEHEGFAWEVNLPPEVMKAIKARSPNLEAMLDDYLASKGTQL